MRKFAAYGRQTSRSQRYEPADPAPVIKVRLQRAQHDKDLRPNMTHTRQALRDQLEPFAAPAP